MDPQNAEALVIQRSGSSFASKNPEFQSSRRCHLVVWGGEATAVLRQLAQVRARGHPARLRQASAAAYLHRWAGILAVTSQRALAASLLELPHSFEEFLDGDLPPLHAILADDAR